MIDDATIAELQKLADLRTFGAISDAEFEVLKAELLGGSPSQVQRDSLERPSGLNIGPYISWWLSKRFNANMLALILVVLTVLFVLPALGAALGLWYL